MTILDTNVLSELMRPEPAAQVVRWVGHQPVAELYTTAITEAEIFYGIEFVYRGKRRDGLMVAAGEMFTEDFARRILAFDSEAARAFSTIAARRRAQGKPISHADAQIAAIAQSHKATLATRNVGDFASCDIRLIDPWGQ